MGKQETFYKRKRRSGRGFTGKTKKEIMADYAKRSKAVPTGLFAQHPLQAVLHHAPDSEVTHRCPKCDKSFSGNVRDVLIMFREHVFDKHMDVLEDCGCCGGYHFPEFSGDCREDWERF